MTETSYNGWPASPTLPTRAITPVPGRTFHVADNDDVVTVFTYLIQQYEAKVDPIEKGPLDDWGFAYRANRNDPSVLSCHSSATAVDLNSSAHPNGIEATANFTPAKIDAIHAILRSIPELDEVIHWGGDWHRVNGLTPDPMHFEIHDHDLEKLHRVAVRIRALSVPPKPAGPKPDSAQAITQKTRDDLRTARAKTTRGGARWRKFSQAINRLNELLATWGKK